MMGLELCFGLLSSLVGQDGLSLNRLIDALSTRPARIAGLAAPRLREGAIAEFVLVDPQARLKAREQRFETKSRNSPFLDHELKGKILMTLSRGSIVFESSRSAQ